LGFRYNINIIQYYILRRVVELPIVRENEWKAVSNREFWVTQSGTRMFAHEFEDDHLVNTIKMLQRKARKYRLKYAQEMCEVVYKFGHGEHDSEEYYRYFTREMDMFMDKSISDNDWLINNSKIYYLLIEEAKYRKLDYKEEEVATSTGSLTYTTTSTSTLPRRVRVRPSYNFSFDVGHGS
jgi:hypothetical protein